MLIGLREALNDASSRQSAVAAINVPYFEGLTAVIRAAEHVGVPVILQHAQVHEAVMPLEEIGPAMRALAERSSARFVLHIDHATDLGYIERGFDIGFNSAMFDGSLLPFEENISQTAEVVRAARDRGFAVEGELGVMTGTEHGDLDHVRVDGKLFTDPAEAKEFVERTEVTALAASFGTVHGLHRGDPKIDYGLLEELHRNVPVPLVMHGGSGLDAEVYRQCARRGVRKINYYSYAAKAAFVAARGEFDGAEESLFPGVAAAARDAVEREVRSFIATLANVDDFG